jgi:hypothetical protein
MPSGLLHRNECLFVTIRRVGEPVCARCARCAYRAYMSMLTAVCVLHAVTSITCVDVRCAYRVYLFILSAVCVLHAISSRSVQASANVFFPAVLACLSVRVVAGILPAELTTLSASRDLCSIKRGCASVYERFPLRLYVS